MSETDYYKILGLNKNASEENIKKSYRKLAMKYHPDHSKGNKSAEEQFKKISEAYAVLSDKEKRKQYDTFGATGFQQRFSQEDIFKGFEFDNIFSELFGKTRNFSGRGNGMRFSFGGGTPFDSYKKQQQARPKGTDLVYELPLTLEEVATGTSKTVSYQHQGRSEKITVKIPKGMISGKKLRVADKGDPGPYGGPPGDLYIQSKVLGDKVYDSKGYNLYMHKEIKLSEALLGSSISIPTLSKKELSLKIPPGTKHKTKMRLAGHGLPHMHSKGKGDLYVYINITMPVKLTKKQKMLIEQLAETGL
ncbi:MAG: J domain-containing protein [Deltaproteobacteria bacterium]|nr:J domain-containing protein [Deltaproteobacteria bacterium]MBW2620815.1 J domain-containing protein [Deltaproteobacteria bacterium]